mgnify:CR=1 FL=1
MIAPPAGYGEKPMELTLRYRGQLAANGRPSDKHKIRKQLHGQLDEFWRQDTRLSEIYKNLKQLQIPKRSRDHFEVDRPLPDPTFFYWRWPLCGYDFIPLVTHVHELYCYLNIRIYRKLGRGGILFTGGDLDNKLKTFFDALRVPQAPEELPNEEDAPNMDDNSANWPHMFCLLDDDRAITKLTIQSFKLLTNVPVDCDRPENYVELDADVTILPATPLLGSLNILYP